MSFLGNLLVAIILSLFHPLLGLFWALAYFFGSEPTLKLRKLPEYKPRPQDPETERLLAKMKADRDRYPWLTDAEYRERKKQEWMFI